MGTLVVLGEDVGLSEVVDGDLDVVGTVELPVGYLGMLELGGGIEVDPGLLLLGGGLPPFPPEGGFEPEPPGWLPWPVGAAFTVLVSVTVTACWVTVTVCGF